MEACANCDIVLITAVFQKHHLPRCTRILHWTLSTLLPPCQTAPPTPQPAWQAHRPNCPPSPLSPPPKKPQKTLENRKKPSTDRPHLLCPGNLQHIIHAPALQEETDQYTSWRTLSLPLDEFPEKGQMAYDSFPSLISEFFVSDF